MTTLDNLSLDETQSIADPTLADLQSASPARQFLDKIAIIENMAILRELNQEYRLEHPAFDNIFKAIEQSPELLKRFLKFANSSWFGSRIQVDSPLMAFTRFGTEGFYRLTISTYLQSNVGELSTRFKIWPHLEWTARAGEMVAQQLAPRYSDEVFAAGLLHDAIVAPMERELQDYLYFLECALSVDPVVTGLENSCHNFDHAQAAAHVARALNFDESIVDAVAAHHHESLSMLQSVESRAVLGLLLCSKRALSVSRGHKKNAFETTTDKALLREIAVAINVSSGRVVNAVSDVVEMLHTPGA